MTEIKNTFERMMMNGKGAVDKEKQQEKILKVKRKFLNKNDKEELERQRKKQSLELGKWLIKDQGIVKNRKKELEQSKKLESTPRKNVQKWRGGPEKIEKIEVTPRKIVQKWGGSQ